MHTKVTQLCASKWKIKTKHKADVYKTGDIALSVCDVQSI